MRGLGGNKINQRIHQPITPEVPEPLGRLPHLPTLTALPCLLCYIQGMLVARGITWEDWGCSILTQHQDGKCLCNAYYVPGIDEFPVLMKQTLIFTKGHKHKNGKSSLTSALTGHIQTYLLLSKMSLYAYCCLKRFC